MLGLVSYPCAPSLASEDEVREDRRSCCLHAGQDVLIDGHRGRGRAEAESLAHDLDRDTGFQPQAGVAVAVVVEADHGQSGAGDEAVKGLGAQVRVDRGALGADEHEPVVRVLFTDGEALFGLSLSPRALEGDRCGSRSIVRRLVPVLTSAIWRA